MKKVMLFMIITVAILTAQDVYRLNDSTFVYPCLVNDSTTNLTSCNFVGLPLETGWTMASDFDPTGTNIDAVTKWGAANNQLVCETAGYHPALGWCTDFPVETGGSYMVNALNNFDFTVVGDSVRVVYDFLPKYNSIILPLTEPDLIMSSYIGNDINSLGGYCQAIYKWDSSNQRWVGTIRSI